MKIRQVVFGLLGLIGLAIAFLVGRYFQRTPRTIHDFNVYVRSNGPGKCVVTTPIVIMSYTNDRVQWLSEDKQYWVDFTHVDPPPGYPPIPTTNPPYTPESPLAHNADHMPFSAGNPTGLSNVKQKVKYYYYAIFDQPDPTQPPCKVSTDDQDTGLNVKP